MVPVVPAVPALVVSTMAGNSKGFSFETTEGETLGLIDNTMLGVADYSKLEN